MRIPGLLCLDSKAGADRVYRILSTPVSLLCLDSKAGADRVVSGGIRARIELCLDSKAGADRVYSGITPSSALLCLDSKAGADRVAPPAYGAGALDVQGLQPPTIVQKTVYMSAQAAIF